MDTTAFAARTWFARVARSMSGHQLLIMLNYCVHSVKSCPIGVPIRCLGDNHEYLQGNDNHPPAVTTRKTSRPKSIPHSVATIHSGLFLQMSSWEISSWSVMQRLTGVPLSESAKKGGSRLTFLQRDHAV